MFTLLHIALSFRHLDNRQACCVAGAVGTSVIGEIRYEDQVLVTLPLGFATAPAATMEVSCSVLGGMSFALFADLFCLAQQHSRELRTSQSQSSSVNLARAVRRSQT